MTVIKIFEDNAFKVYYIIILLHYFPHLPFLEMALLLVKSKLHLAFWNHCLQPTKNTGVTFNQRLCTINASHLIPKVSIRKWDGFTKSLFLRIT